MARSSRPNRASANSVAERDGLIITADDFGLAPEVNEAVERAHRDGVLSAASLMVAGPAAEEAVALAHRTPSLRVGLHLVLSQGRPILPASDLPDLVDADGVLRGNLFALGVDIALRARVRRQVAAEIEAQFQAFARTALPLDHVSGHEHFHIHPAIARMLLDIGPRYGMRALRVPAEPPDVLRRLGGKPRGFESYADEAVARPAATEGEGEGYCRRGCRLRSRLERRHDGGAPRRAGWWAPRGMTEIYLHPATHDDFPGHAPGYHCRKEFEALLDSGYPGRGARLRAHCRRLFGPGLMVRRAAIAPSRPRAIRR